MRHLIVQFLMLFLILSCGGGGSSGVQNGIPAAASDMDTKLKTNMVRSLQLIPNIESSLLFVMNPGIPMAQGVTVAPGSLSNSITFAGPYDGNGNGFNETTMTGSATFNSDPNSGWDGMDGQVAVDVNIPLVGHVYHADINFSITSAERRLTGSGTFTDPISGNATTMSTTGTPLVIKLATGSAGAISNACGYSLDGQINLKVEGATGTLISTWNFSPSNSSVAVNGASFIDTSNKTTSLPNSSVDLRCGSSGSINDWVATFDQSYACLPRESGQSTITVTVTGADTISIFDEDPPGSGNIKTYDATIVAANPYAVRGFFIGGPMGNRYREDFNWTLGKNGSSFTQISNYIYIEGPNTGSGGICVASAKRLP
jgi:hypothetical protein